MQAMKPVAPRLFRDRVLILDEADQPRIGEHRLFDGKTYLVVAVEHANLGPGWMAVVDPIDQPLSPSEKK